MSLVDFILNLAGLLLWLNWRSARLDPLSHATPATLVGTLRRAEPPRVKRWHFLLALAGLIFIRALFYWQLGPALNWTAGLNLIVTKLAFQSAFFGRMLLYSILSFGLMLGIFFLWLLLLSLLAPAGVENFAFARLARLHLGRVDGWPRWVKLVLPWLAGAILWWLSSWVLPSLGLLPRPRSAANRIGQAALVGFSAYLGWKYLVAGLLTLHLVGNYVFFGTHPLWSYTHATSRRLLTPLEKMPLRVGKMDFAPVVGIAIVFFAARQAEIGLAELFQLWSR